MTDDASFSRSLPSPPDAGLVKAAQRGDKRAFVELVARHQAMVCGVALGVLGDFAASEDAAQEAFITAWRKIHEVREPEKVRAWLARIARNAALGQRRRMRGGPAREMEVESADEDHPPPDQSAISEEEAALVREALDRLPETYRLPLVLFYRQEQSVREVAAALDLSEDAVKQRLARGRELLRERLAGLVETTLRRTQPGAIFTMTIAAAIGALAAPAAIASGAFAAAATTSAVTTTTATSTVSTTTPAAVTAMTTSKFSLAAALVAAACLPLGYAVYPGAERPLVAPEAVVTTPEPAAAAAKPDFSDSALFAEWVRLHEEHGHDAEAMPGLFQAISEIKDTFRRRAFRAALVAEWSEVDPAGGLDFFLDQSGSRDPARQLFREWLAREPQAAVAKLLSHGATGDALAGEKEILAAIARRAPEAVAAIAARLPANTNHWHHPVREAFAILAEDNLDAARAAAEALTGPRRNEALEGVAKAWAQKDFAAAAAWVKTLPDGFDHEGILRSALLGLAATDPTAALDQADLVAPGGHPGYFADTTAAKLLKEAGARDFDGIAAWLRDHPGKISGEDMVGLAPVVTDKLNADPVAFLDEQAARGTLATLQRALRSALMNDAKPQLAAVWDWLKTQPFNDATRALRQSVLNTAGWQNPEFAFAIAAELPATEAGDQDVAELTRSLLNGGQRLGRIDELLETVPGRLRESLLVSAFQYLSPDGIGDPASWLTRLEEVPVKQRAGAAANFAGVWAYRNPEDAAAWAAHLPGDGGRVDAVRNVARAWLRSDSLAASEWIAQWPAGPERDAGASMLVREIAADSPDDAWQWAVSITGAEARMKAARAALSPLLQRDPAEALHWIEASTLAETEKQTLRQGVTAGAVDHPTR